jgi:putative heme-binding domain-containing protein
MKWNLTALLLLTAAAAPAAPLELKKGDHISLIGNTLADRMQHHGWLETLLHSRFPEHELTVRNLGFSGDELTLRLRSASFGSPDHWLAANRTDVVFAFFGYNESFGGKEGLGKFKKDLEKFIKDTRSQKYNGRSAPQLVLFSPIAHEDLKDRNLPDGRANNERLALYTAAMAEVARANNVRFVDLFAPSQELYRTAPRPLTINGIHLTERGDQLLAAIIDRALFGEPPAPRDPARLEKIRQAVLDKNFYWFNRYRTVDGYSIYGGRADLRFVNGQTNRVVMQREMEVLDVMTANRDLRIWAVARGKDLKIDDANTPPFIPVMTNKPGPGPNGEHIFLSGEEAIQKMTLGKGLKINLFASEKEFPELAKPVQMAWDTKGRLWVAVWPTYPHWKPKEEMNDKILIFEDTDGDGKADKCTVFADHLHCPTGFEFYNGGVLVAQAPDLVFLKDTDGDGKADYRERVLSGLDSADTHHTANSFALDPGGALYFQEGTFHHTQVETPYGPPVRCANAGVFRYEPRTQKFESYISFGFANPHGHVFDHWGQDIVVDGTGAVPYHAALFSGRIDFPQKHAKPPQVYQQRTRPCAGIEILSSRHFPAEFQGNLLVTNVIVPTQGILRYRIDDKGASFAGTEQEVLVSSSDPNFRPADVKVGPDGAVYFLDWQNPIIGHMQHNLRDPSRDREHGRIYRITYAGRELLKPVPIAGEPIEKLLEVLKEPEDRVRYRARIELAGRKTEDVLAAAGKWLAALDRKDRDYEHHRLEALWLHQAHNVVNVELLKQVLHSPDFRARAAAARVLCYWRDRVPGALELFKELAADRHPRVRLEAIRAASFFPTPEAMEVVFISQEQPTDPYLDYTRGETLKVLDPLLKAALAEGRKINFTTETGARYLLRSVPLEQLLTMERSRVVNRELLYRSGVREEVRREALRALAQAENKGELRVLFDAIAAIDEKKESRDENVIFDLVRLATSRGAGELAAARSEIEKLATTARQPVIRQIGFVSLINVDGTTDKAWQLALKSATSLRDLVEAMPLIPDASLRAGLYPKVEPLLQGLPPELAGAAGGKTVRGRYIRVELPGRQRTLTLAEVEVFSNGQNVARKGKASQKNTAHGGDASKAIDGNKSGRYADGGQTHTEEGTSNPWWEVDLGAEFPIESVVIYNRTDGNLSNRLNNFTLRVLDRDRKVVFERQKNPAPEGSAAFEVGREAPEVLVRRAAMNALTSVRGQEAKTFQTLARFVRNDAERSAAIHALQRIPRKHWPKEEAKPLLDVLLAYIRKVPAKERTLPGALEALEFADALTTLLPPDEAKAVRAELGELGVRVVRVATLPERMAYDKEVIVVKAGKPVEFLFENTDLMPHNFVITVPGALEEIGTLAESTATQPDAPARHFVPKSAKILLAGKLLQPRESERLSFVAPQQPGVYPYVCTYPGHWRRMYGALYVVEDVDAYLANPESYLASSKLPVKDELLKDRRPRTEWKFEDLSAAVEEMKNGRSYGNGKQMFQVASCIACHKLEGIGNQFGPDLAQLDPKLKPLDILKDIVEPSFKINEKFQTFVIATKAGKTYTGLILEETPEALKIIENPLVKAEPLVLKKSEIESREKSAVSVMPKGLLDKLTRDEILDLIAYLAARGNRNHELFQGEGHAHGHQH